MPCTQVRLARQPVIFLDWSQYGAPGWTEACAGVDLSDLIGGWSGSKVVELLELQTLYPIGGLRDGSAFLIANISHQI